MVLVETVDALRAQLGLAQGTTLAEAIGQAVTQLGLESQAKNMTLQEKADLCIVTLGLNSNSTAMSACQNIVVDAVIVPATAVPMGQPVAMAVPMGASAHPMAPTPQQMSRAIPASSLPGRTTPLKLDGIGLTGDCCCLFPPPVFVCCCSDITRGHEVAVVYDSTTGFLLRPQMCNQRIHVGWGNYNPGSKVLSFHCGCFDCPDNEQWDLFTDGTIRPRHHSHLAIGLGRASDGNLRTILVSEHDHAQRMVFRSVQELAPRT